MNIASRKYCSSVPIQLGAIAHCSIFIDIEILNFIFRKAHLG